MAIAHVNSYHASGTPYTISVTVTGTDKLLLSALSGSGATSFGSTTWDGLALTEITNSATGTGSTASRVKVEYYLNPTSKTADWTGSGGSSAGVSIYQGVDQSTIYRTPSTDTTNTDRSSVTLSPTSSTNDLVVDFISRQDLSSDIVPDGSQTERFEATSASARAWSSSLPGSASSTTMGASWTGADRTVYVAFALIPAAAGGGFPKINGITTYSSINGVTTFTSINGVT